MNYLADLHVHSHYSRATSKASHLHGLAAWAAVKGIAVVATGDCTHPGWFAHLHEHLEPAETGFFRLLPDQSIDWPSLVPEGIRPAASPADIRFVLSAEISSIYKRGGRVRKVHNLLYLPDLDSARRINAKLATLGNIASDGRPILGLDSRDLLEILLDQAPEGFLVPAHIWTPWFSLFGSKSGFDTIEECFGDLSDQVFALETGLSSDPEMNRLISALDRFTLISNSDCHSPAKLGREANLFATGFDFFSLREAIRTPQDAAGNQRFTATVEFYPEEGKYHCDGHRKCGVCLEPARTREHGGLCPHCGRPLTIGVLHRVMELADRPQAVHPPGAPAVHSLIPLLEITAELLGCGPSSRKATDGYVRLVNAFGSEFGLLLDTPVEEIRARGFTLVAEAIERLRADRVIRHPGYDGEFGVIRVFAEGERAALCGQGQLFAPVAETAKAAGKRQRIGLAGARAAVTVSPVERTLNAEQQRAVASTAARILVQAGPGTGKTHTLVSRVERLAAVADRPCTVITFTNKAAAEVRARLQSVTGAERVRVATFHGYCLAQLRRETPELRVAGPEERAGLLDELFPDCSARERDEFSAALSRAFRAGAAPADPPELARYPELLAERAQIDLEAVVGRTVQVLEQGGPAAEAMRRATGHLFVDEFQDVNQAQYRLVALLAATSTVFAIGDPDQAIYGFRGSDPRWFAAFIDEFAPETHQLVRNYRSGTAIVAAAGAVIAANPHPRPMAPMRAESARPGAIHVQRCASPEHEAAWIADQIEAQLGGISHRSLERLDQGATARVSFADIGVLYRTARQGETIAAALAGRSIPFQLVDLEACYTRGDCRPLYLWLLLLAGLASDDEQLALLGRCAGVGRHSLRLLRRRLRAIPPVAASPFVGDRLGPADGPVGAALHRFRSLYDRLCALAADQPVEQVLLALAHEYHLDPQQPDLVRLRQLSLTFGNDLPACAAHLQTFSDSVLYDARAEAVTLSTLHAAKGLEFPLVCIAGAEAGLLPLAPRRPLTAEAKRAHLEEERRLFYVGLTRAIATLCVSWAASRAVPGEPMAERQPSPFLADIPAPLVTAPPAVRLAAAKPRPVRRQLSLFPGHD